MCLKIFYIYAIGLRLFFERPLPKLNNLCEVCRLRKGNQGSVHLSDRTHCNFSLYNVPNNSQEGLLHIPLRMGLQGNLLKLAKKFSKTYQAGTQRQDGTEGPSQFDRIALDLVRSPL